MFASESISALVIVILCSSHLSVCNQDIDPNSSILEATRIEDVPSTFHKPHLDSVEKADHNFYLQLGKTGNSARLRNNDDSRLSLTSAKLTKKPPTCSSYLQTFTSTPKRQCSFIKPSLFHENLAIKAVPNLNATENCERPDIFFKSNDTKTESITQDTLSSQNNATNETKESSTPSSIDSIIIKQTDAKDMLSFEEWRKKISEKDVASVPKLPDLSPLEHSSVDIINNNQQQQQPSLNIKLATNRARNFASHECGAKVVDSNSEADFVNRVLNEQTDEYMLNPCKTKNWFVIELCETIQPQYLEMANFELYSSIPKDFTIYASEHYPARNDWSILGTFTSNDVRSLQGFKLQKNGFVKYLKIELHSYYGSEHFCPISVIRAFGTSLFDEVERIDKSEPIDFINRDENSIFEESLERVNPGADIFGSAKKAVYNIFVKALNFNIFNKILDNFSQSKDLSPSFNIRDQSQVIKLYPNFEMYLAQCESYFISDNKSTVNIPSKCLFLQFFFPEQLFDMLYTQYFIKRYINKDLLFQCGFNATYHDLNTTGLSLILTNSMQALHSHLNHRNAYKETQPNLSDKLSENISYKNINTTFTSSVAPSLSIKVPQLNYTLESSLLQPTLISPTITNTQHTLPLQSTVTVPSVDSFQSSASQRNHTSAIVQQEAKTEQLQLPSITSLASEYENDGLSSSSGQSKEAVIVRLTSRIKNLEKNISLMSTYLENLSVRYRNQMEEMQLVFNRTIDHLNNTAIKAAEKDAKQQEFIMALESEINVIKAKLASSLDTKDDFWLFTQIHIFLMIFEFMLVMCFCLIFYFSFRRISSSLFKNISNNRELQILKEDNKLIAQSNTQTKKYLYRSKSMSDLKEPLTNKDSIANLVCETSLIGDNNNDCDKENSNKENCTQIPNSVPFNNCNSFHPNLGDITIDTSAKKILKAVNN